MHIIYVDQSNYHQHGLVSLIDGVKIHCHNDLRSVENKLFETEIHRQIQTLLIFDLPAHFLTAISYAECLADLKSKYGLKLILFSDKERNPFNFSKNYIQADFFIDKKLPSETILKTLNRIIKNEKKTPKPFAVHAQNELNENEIIFLRCLFTKGTIEGVARVTRKKPKALYNYQASLVKKLNLKNTLHLYKSLIHSG